MANIVHATGPAEIAAVGALFAEYARAVDAPCCFAGLERELATLPGEYAPPAGRLFLALDASGSAGCVAPRCPS
jgi:putative acetyltransferase